MVARDTRDLTGPDQLVITVNGPGEISAWLYPLADAVKRLRPDLHVAVCLLPCVFSSGAEAHVLDGFETVDAVADVPTSFRLIRRNELPEGFRRDGRTLIFHLGGEVALTHMIARRLKAPVFGYVEAKPSFARRFAKLFYSGLNAVPVGGEAVGELMVDAARLRRAEAQGARGTGTVIGLFPGSRDYMVRHILPFFAAAADRLAVERPDLRFVMAQAPYITDDFLADFPPPSEDRIWEASAVRYSEDGGRRLMVSEKGTRIEILPGPEVLGLADYAISLPGTNTGEMAASGIPMVVVLPTQMAEHHVREVPLPGIAGHVGRIPVLGPWLKRVLGHRVLRQLPVLALPNRRAGRTIVPELSGTVTPDEVAGALGELIDRDPKALQAEVRASMGAPGAAARLADEIAAYFAAA